MTLHEIVPIFPVSDIDVAVTHYRALGFTIEVMQEASYGFAERDGIKLQLQQVTGRPKLDPKRNMFSTYLYCDDADALHAEWSASGAGGTDVAPRDTSYGLREGAHLDADANLIRFGSPLAPASD